MYLAENPTPQPGKAYAINKKSIGTAVTVVDGTRVAMRYWEGLPTQKWECVKKDGWLGFICRASTDCDAYLGHDDYDVLICKAPHHREWEHFQVMLHDEGFPWEMRKNDYLTLVGITGGGGGLKVLAECTTWWSFTPIESATTSTSSLLMPPIGHFQ